MGKLIERPTKAPDAIPPLREGDRLTAKEFLRRYEADADVTRAELINGVVYVNAVGRADGMEETMSPITAEFHSSPQADMIVLFGTYAARTPGVLRYGPTTVMVDDRTLPEPDAILRVAAACGGASDLNRKSYIVGPPELLVEIANTSVAVDMGPKYEAYQTGGIAEYFVWRTARREMELFALRRGGYVPVAPNAGGVIQCGQFPGLWLDTVGLLSGDFGQALATLQIGLASPEHAAFVAKLAAARAKRKRK